MLRRPLRPYSRDRAQKRRAGLTLIEVIVLLLVAGLLLALALPAVNQRRPPARRLQCLNTLKHLGVAVVNYQSQDNDRLPLLATETRGWPCQLLPLLDSAALARQLRDDPSAVIDPKTGVPVISLRFFTCPEDSNNFRLKGGLSYAGNAGYMTSAVWGDPGADASPDLSTAHVAGSLKLGDGTFDEQVALHVATGVFWRRTSAVPEGAAPQDAPRMTGAFISEADGLSNTLMFAENVNSRNWGSTNVNDIGFGLSIPTRAGSRVPDRSAPAAFLGGEEPLALQSGFSLAAPDGDDATFNSNLHSAQPGHAPRPSAFHHGVINVCFADGRAVGLDANIDPSVYARLLTPAGERYGQTEVDMNEVE